jgi:hypothetical protein
MKRTPMRRTSGFASKVTAAMDREQRLDVRSARMANLMEIQRAAPPVARGVVARFTDEVNAVPKDPADRNQNVRDLAMGEECQVRYMPVCRGPGVTEFTVWAHPNTLDENKGGAYKGHDSAGVFACDRCHWAIDFDRKVLPQIHLEEVWRGARDRTLIRLRAIACSYTERPWRVKAAQWAIHQHEQRLKEKA